MRPLLRLTLGLLLVLLLASCRTEDNSLPEPTEEPRIISLIEATDNDAELVVSWFPAPCETFNRIEVTPTADQIELELIVIVDAANCPTGSITSTVVQLGEPRAGREVFDLTFDDTVRVE